MDLGEEKLEQTFEGHLEDGAFNSIVTMGRVLGIEDSALARLFKCPLEEIKKRKEKANKRVMLLKAHKAVAERVANDYLELRLDHLVAGLFERANDDLSAMLPKERMAVLVNLLKERRALSEKEERLAKLAAGIKKEPVDSTDVDNEEAKKEFEKMYAALQEAEYAG